MVRSVEPLRSTTPAQRKRRAPSTAAALDSNPPSRRSTPSTGEARPRRSSATPPLPAHNGARDLRDVPSDGSDVQVIGLAHPPSGISPFPGFRVGNLVKVEMTNFLTFSHTAIYPGPRMNLILGPNGTGKSTICNAVCIVFAGSPRILGRGTELGSFVKHGEKRASIEALIYDPSCPGGVQKIVRDFDSDGKGAFYINDRRAKVADVMAVNHRYDIQLDNLSQFMPQEKIAEFTLLRPNELLAITVRSLGGTKKEKLFHELSKLDQDVSSYTSHIQEMESSIEKLSRQQEADEGEVQAYIQQQAAKERLVIYKKFLPQLQARELDVAYQRLLQERVDSEQELKILKESITEADAGPVNALQQESDSMLESYKAAKHRAKQINERSNAPVMEAENISLRLSQRTKELQDAEKMAERRRMACDQAEAKLAAAQAELDEYQESIRGHDLNAQFYELDERKRSIRSQMDSESDRRSPLEHQRQDAARAIKYFNEKLSNLADVRQQRIAEISQKTRATYLVQCDALVREMKAKRTFRGDVRGPVAAEIEVGNAYHARIMEASVTGFLMSAFVTEYASDSRLLISACKQRFSGWSPDIITAPTTPADERDTYAIDSQRPNRPVDDRLRSLGIECCVNDIYKSPPAVRAALNAQAGLHSIHVGNEESEARKGELRKEDGMNAWFTPRSRCQVVTSRYDRSVRNLRVDTQFATRTGQLFAGSSERSMQERERLIGEIREYEGKLAHAGGEMKAIEEQLHELKQSSREIEKELLQVSQRRKDGELKRLRVEQASNFLSSLRERVAAHNIVQQKKKLVAEIQELEKNGAKTVVEATEGLKKLQEGMLVVEEQLAKYTDALRRLEAEKSKQSEIQNQIAEKKEECKKAKDLARDAKRHLKKKKVDAERAISEDERFKHAELLKELEARDAEWLEDEINQQVGRVAGLATSGPQVLEDYKHRQRKIVDMTERLNSERSQYEERMGRLRRQKEEFLSWLQEGVEKMRAKFSRLYRRLGCSGDLELVNKESERIADLELQILVSYRDKAELRAISSSANSGGEKMCCTMLFCFSLLLEEERMPPFVFVDELNQGLDPCNEMKIMTMMFEDAEQDIAPQSFVITPKLLLNLPFHARTKTHIIFNGAVSGKLDVAAPQQ